jgi:hypothetical protein
LCDDIIVPSSSSTLTVQEQHGPTAGKDTVRYYVIYFFPVSKELIGIGWFRFDAIFVDILCRGSHCETKPVQ